MTRSAQETNVVEIARELVKRRDQGQRPILFLGSRTGGLYGNEYLYETLKQFSFRNFDTLSNIAKFKECYSILGKHFTENERYNLLIDSLATLKQREEEDKRLAGLIATGLFEAIVSTNIDTLLENGFNLLGLHESADYQVFIPGGNKNIAILYDKLRYSPIIKIFGDLESRHYRVAGEMFDLQADDDLWKYLLSKLERDVLMVGYDPVWDQAIEQAFPLHGGTIWYVNEIELPTEKSNMPQIIKGRESQYLAGHLGKYSEFLRLLCDQDVIYKMVGKTIELSSFSNNNHTMNNKAVIPNISATTPMENVDIQTILAPERKKTIFISYSHEDKKYLKELSSHFKSFNNPNNSARKMNIDTDFWSDEKIEVGKDWQEKILQALEEAEVAILLISQHFLSSKFITEVELPQLLNSFRNRELVIIPVILRKCMFHQTPLQTFQAINGGKPLEDMKPAQRNQIWVRVIEQAIKEKTPE